MVMGRPMRARKPVKPQRPPYGGGSGAALRAATAAMGAVLREARSISASVSTSISDPAAPFAWDAGFADFGTLYTAANSTTTLATNVPNGSTVSASPDLLPGQTLSLSGSTLSIVGDSTVPTVDGTVSGSPKDTISGRDIVIEVLDSPLARARNLRYPLVWWGQGEPADTIFGLPGGHSRLANVLSPEYGTTPCISGDTIEISPGAIAATGAEASAIEDGGFLHVLTSVHMKNIDGRGRWSLLPQGVSPNDNGHHGIIIHRPGAAWLQERISATIEGFDFNNYGSAASAVRIRSNVTEPTSWNDWSASLTLRNFKAGKSYPNVGYSILSGATEVLTVEDAHLYNGGNDSGQEHDAYVSARTMTWRGVRVSRDWRPNDGQQLKLTALFATIEGCVFDAGPGDNSLTIQMKGGGTLVVRGCLLIGPEWSNTATGLIMFEKETNNYGGDWAYAQAVHSVTVEKNVLINHRPYAPPGDQKALVYFRPSDSPRYVSGVSQVLVRDNIGMSTVPDSLWIQNDPTAGAAWVARGNTAMTYAADETGFSDRALKLYTRTAGTVAASGTVATKRFVWPHGSIDRTDAFRGLA
jgi:hypothetical protein